MSRKDLQKRVRKCAGELVAEKGYVSPVDLLIRMDRLTPKQVKDWRFKHIPYLERVTVGNLAKMNMILRALRRFAEDTGLKASFTVYNSWGKSAKQRLRFSKSGNPHLEEMYATHYIKMKKRKQQ